MTIVRRIARPLLAAAYIQSGVDAVRHPGPKVEAARPLISKIAEPLRLPDDPELLIRANGAVRASAGTLFALGRLPRLSALLMALSLAPSAYINGAFWREKDPEQRRAVMLHFLTTLGLLGGTLLAAVDTEGRPGLAWRGKHAGRSAKKAAARASKDAKRTAGRASKDAKKSAKLAKIEARAEVHKAASRAHGLLPG